MDNCIFCKIINGQIPAAVVYEDDRVIAFNDINPVAPVHIIIIPREHIASANDLTVENAGVLPDIFLAAQKIAEKLGIASKGYRLINNCGADAGQTVFHMHFHLLGGVVLGPKII
ncbi:MAG: histidine triad nucleotide-binding protein [Clostridiales bacterium GWC2_40_7]|nr:MAG: histidine triad nucleotide-binding protein [Clostridiales bacterium GWC2_40_7]